MSHAVNVWATHAGFFSFLAYRSHPSYCDNHILIFFGRIPSQPNFDTNPAEHIEQVTFYQDCKDLPVFPCSLLSCTENDKVVKVLLNASRKHNSYIASTNPVSVQNNVNFVVDLEALEQPEDLLSDDLGAWEQTKTRSKWYDVRFGAEEEVRQVTKVEDKLDGSYQVCRRPFINKSDRSLRKTIINVIHPGGHHHSLVFVKYHFEGAPEHAVEVKPHGNSSRCCIPYLRTYKSTRNKLKEAVEKQHSGVKRAVHDVGEAVGGLKFCNSKGALPRSERQASYLRQSSKEAVVDPIFDITQKMKLESENGEEKFIRGYNLDDDSPKVILFTDDQVDDVVNFCCNDVTGHKSLLYVDVTFQLGPFFVLMITYKNTTVFTRRSQPPTCPLMIGPMMLCMLKDKSTYLTLFQKLTAQVPGLKVYLQGYSSDSEDALKQALAHKFERSLSFLCKIHVQRNIVEKCRKLHLSQSVTDVLIHDIFGSGGLVYSETEQAYKSTLDELRLRWDRLELADTNKPPRFARYYHVYKSEIIWHHVTAKASRDAGFEDKAQTNNVPESANALLKRWQGFQSADMSSFIDDVKTLIDKQRCDVQRAFLGLHSLYVVRPEYADHVKSQSDFFDAKPGRRSFSEKPTVDPARYKEVRRYRPTPARPVGLLETEDVEETSNEDQFPSTTVVPQAESRTPNKPHVEQLEALCMSSLQGIFTRKDLQSLTAKAKQLILEGSIREGFDPQSFFVKSSSSCNPHTVKSLSSGKYACDKDCLGYKTRKICAHVLAVACYNKQLAQFIQSFKDGKHDRSRNLTAITTFGVNASAGKKRQHVRRSRNKSPDAMTSTMTTEQPAGGTIADLFSSHSAGYSTEASSDPLRITIRRNRPAKPTVLPTTSTPFQLISISGHIRKCAGCGGNLKDGPDQYTHNFMDERYCIRHKEHDYVWIESMQHWKKKFENKHYHVFLTCIKGRNPNFDASTVQLSVNHTLGAEEVQELKNRL